MASVGSILGGAFRLFTERPGAILAWALVYFAAAIAIALTVSWIMTGSPAIVTDPAAFMPQGPSGMHARFWKMLLVIYPVSLVLTAVLLNAVFRAVLRPEDSSFASLRLGMDELRTIGLAILVVVVAMIAMIILQLLLMLMVSFVGMVAGTGVVTGLFGLALLLASVAGWVWIWVRLSLLFPLTFHRRKISVDAAWALSRGRFWTLFGAYLVAVLVVVALGLAIVWVTMGDYLAATWAAGRDFEAVQRAQAAFVAHQMQMPGWMRLAQMLLSSFLSILSFVLAAGIPASATRELLIEQGQGSEEQQDWSEAEI